MSLLRTPKPGFSGEVRSGRFFAQSIMILLCAFAVSACGMESPFSGRNNDAPRASSASADGQPTHSIPPIPAPPGSGDRPTQPGQTGRDRGPDGLPVMQARGLNADQLFAEDIRDQNRRFGRLENAVIEIRRDLDAMMPAISRLIAVEKDIQDLIAQLEILLYEDSRSSAARASAPDRSPAPVAASGHAPVPLQQSAESPAPSPSVQDALASTAVSSPPRQQPPAQDVQPARQASPPPVPAASAAGTPVRQMRIGEHGDKTRIVLDTGGSVSYRYDVDNHENLMIVELDGVAWQGQQSWSSQSAPLVTAYSVQPGQGGQPTRLVVQLRHDASVIKDMMLPPNDTPYHRLVIDLKSPAVHR